MTAPPRLAALVLASLLASTVAGPSPAEAAPAPVAAGHCGSAPATSPGGGAAGARKARAEKDEGAAFPEAASQRLPNPAHARCLAEGYRVEPVVRGGIPADAECVDPTSGARCPVWAWFRGECRLMLPAGGP